MSALCGERSPHDTPLFCDVPADVEHRVHIEARVGAWIGESPISWYRGEKDGKPFYAPADVEVGGRRG